MAILEDIFEELKLLHKNLRVLNTELSTVDSSTVQEKVKEAPMPKEETAQLETIEEVKETSTDLTKDYILSVGKAFLKKADTSDKKELELKKKQKRKRYKEKRDAFQKRKREIKKVKAKEKHKG
uniref:hypothetical protein n=1 Tax=Staphylococcus aureus TaxID=1280 RepID=UPI00210AB497